MKINMKKILFGLVFVMLISAVVELLSFCILLWAENFKAVRYTPISDTSLSLKNQNLLNKMLSDSLEYIAYDSVLGWGIKKNGKYGKYSANSQGIRANRVYEEISSIKVLRIASFGDSFTHGDEVKNEETWQEVLSTLGNNLEVINFGVPAYGLDQAYLRYEHHGKMFNPDIVLIGFMSENINRNVNIFPPFYVPDAAVPLSKPRFHILNDSLHLQANPLNEIGDYRSLLNQPQEILPIFAKDDFHFNSRRGFYKTDMIDVF